MVNRERISRDPVETTTVSGEYQTELPRMRRQTSDLSISRFI